MVLKLKKRDKIYLIIKNLKIKNLKIKNKSKKVDHVRVKPFFIHFKKRTISYKLNLLKDKKVYSIFHILP